MKRFVCVLFLIAILSVACGPVNTPPAPESDSGQGFALGATVKVDDGVYIIKGEVVTDVDSLTRQTQAASGYMSGSAFGGFGMMSGVYYGAEFGGKGFIRLKVMESESYLAPIGKTVILKSTDTKGIALLPGDIVTFKCRHQYEAIAAVRDSETFDVDKLETWEIDYCRMVSPVVSDN
jgi:hypothetical protein